VTVLLDVANLTVRYEKATLINGLSMQVAEGEMVGLVGPNGAGKSTLLRAVAGLVAWEREIHRRSTRGAITLEGEVRFLGERIDQVPAHEIVRRGLVLCPERRRPFRELTVRENLAAGAYLRADLDAVRQELEKVYRLFPVLERRAAQIAGTLSGGEQQMLAIGRALMSRPKLLCIDEPSTGLAPIVRAELFQKIAEIRGEGITILLVEQEVGSVFRMSDRNYVLSSGKIIAQGSGEELLQDEVLKRTYLGL
jgi:branched-chain amino acid transport system ATP-binding protein